MKKQNIHFVAAKKGAMLTFNEVKDDQGTTVTPWNTLFECNVQILIILGQIF